MGTQRHLQAEYDLGRKPSYNGSTVPEASVVAEVGSVYHRSNGETWTKATGSGNTGWVCMIRIHTATPEGAITAPIGALCVNTAGGASTTLYVKTSGAGNTGWTAK